MRRYSSGGRWAVLSGGTDNERLRRRSYGGHPCDPAIVGRVTGRLAELAIVATALAAFPASDRCRHARNPVVVDVRYVDPSDGKAVFAAAPGDARNVGGEEDEAQRAKLFGKRFKLQRCGRAGYPGHPGDGGVRAYTGILLVLVLIFVLIFALVEEEEQQKQHKEGCTKQRRQRW